MERSNLKRICSQYKSLLLLLFIPLVAYGTIHSFDQVVANKLNVDNVQIDGNTVSTTNTNGNLTFDMNGTGAVILTDLTASTVLQLDASKKISSSAVTTTELGYVSGVTGAIQTQLDAKMAKSTATTKGDIFVATGSATIVRQGIGTDGQVLTADSGQTNGLKWATPSGGGDGATNSASFTSSGTFVVPTDVNYITVKGCGGGGGGGGGGGNSGAQAAAGGGGGGAGAPVYDVTVPVTPGETLTVTIGSGGAGASGTSGTGPTRGTNGSITTVSGTGVSLSFPGGGSGGGGGGGASTAGLSGNNGLTGIGGAGGPANGTAGGGGGGGGGFSGKGADGGSVDGLASYYGGGNGRAGGVSGTGGAGAGGTSPYISNGSGAAGGLSVTTNGGGGGGGGASIGAGGAGGAGNSGTAGTSASANTCAGGGGGGGKNGASSSVGATGGTGGKGVIFIYWIGAAS